MYCSYVFHEAKMSDDLWSGKEFLLFQKVYSGGIQGIDGYLVQVEADVGPGLPGLHLVGYLASEVREAQERVRAAMKNSGFRLSPMKTTVNVSPADIRKQGTAFDVPIAVAILAAYGLVREDLLRESAFIGELGLDGSIKPVHGVLSLVSAFAQAGIRRCFLPCLNMFEGTAIDGISIYPVADLKTLIEGVNHPEILVAASHQDRIRPPEAGYKVDYLEVSGQHLLKRATEVAVAGQHNILYIGPAGSGKSMIAGRIPTIMPPLTRDEQLEISKIYSVCGMLPSGVSLLECRPFRSPHHTSSPQALTGGGKIPRPGEISLASRGVLFLDEFPEFQRRTIEVLRQPLEERRIKLSRVYGCYEFPAHFMLAAAMNPCPCGFYPDRSRCSCDENQVRRYLGKISRPLMDRIDICVEAAPLRYHEMQVNEAGESSAMIRARVMKAWEIQKSRYLGYDCHFNSDMGQAELAEYCRLELADQTFFEAICDRMSLSIRGCHKILKVARTIADLSESAAIKQEHLAEAVGYRRLEEKYWGKGV